MFYRLVVVLLVVGTFPLVNGAFAQQNAGFERTAESGSNQPLHWSTGGKGYEITVTDKAAYRGSRSLQIQRTESGRFGVATQTLKADSLDATRLRLSGYIKTQDTEEGYAGLWVRVDGPESMLALKNMEGRGATGTTPWTRHKIEVRVPKEAERILFGALMPGSGTAWFDSLELEQLGSPANEELPPPSDEARAYLNRALDVMEKRSIKRDSIDWPELREATMRRARGAETTADTYSALRYAIDRLGDGHSFLRTPDPETQQKGSNGDRDTGDKNQQTSWGGPAPRGTLLSGEVGYVNVPSFAGSGESGVAFADSLQNVVKDLSESGVCGWIVDLRDNTGGNMWPMIAGIGPVLGDGTLGKFVGPDGNEQNWWYRDGKAGVGPNTITEVSRPPRKLARSQSPVAVLTGPRTASSGEAVVVSFQGRPNTQSFGQPTRGLSTSNATIPLSDGATLLLTTATFADRTGTVYGDAIEPDVIVQSGDTSSSLGDDPVVEAGRSWLKKKPRCSSSTKRQ